MRGSWLKIYTIMKRQLPKMKYILKINLKNKQGILLILILFPILSFAQTEFTTWGNITGIRVDNQLMEFNTSLIIIDDDYSERKTRKEGQRINFKRELDKKIFSYEMDSLSWRKTLYSKKKGTAVTEVDFSSTVDTLINGAYFRIDLPEDFNTASTSVSYTHLT